MRPSPFAPPGEVPAIAAAEVCAGQPSIRTGRTAALAPVAPGLLHGTHETSLVRSLEAYCIREQMSVNRLWTPSTPNLV